MNILSKILYDVFLINLLFDYIKYSKGHIQKSRIHISPIYRNIDEENTNESNIPVFRCPSKCTCEMSTTIAHRVHSFANFDEITANFENGNENGDKKSLSIYCHRGGLNDTDFFDILQQITGTFTVTILDIRAPTERPNIFQWNDNLNRLTKLKRLALVNCGIPALSRSVHMPVLKHLDLSQNKIDEIQLGAFIGTPLLETLDLSRNRIKTLPTGAFMYSRRLKHISLSHNSISDLAAGMLRGPERLLELELDGNGKNGHLEPQQINEVFMDVGNVLERLEINSCNLKNVDIDNIQFSRTSNLRRLGLANNSLTEVPSIAIRALEHLQTIDLGHNIIKTLQPCSFCACNITRVFLKNNLLGLDVKLVNNRLPLTVKSIHREAFADTKIIELDISHNFFHFFDSRWLHDAQYTLRILHLSGNKLEQFQPEFLHTLPQLTHLHMAENDIKEVPYTLSKHYAQLQFLNLSGNILQNLPINLHYFLPSIHLLDLSYNRFSTISPIVMTTFINDLDQVYLHHNPWDCACATQDIQQYMLQRLSYRRQLNYDHTVCDRPPFLRGQPLHRVQKINDCAVLFGSSYGLTQISELLLLLSGLLIAAFIVFVLVIFILHCGREHKRKAVYVTNEHSQIQLTHPLDISINHTNGNEANLSNDNNSTYEQLLKNGEIKFMNTSTHSDTNNNLNATLNGSIKNRSISQMDEKINRSLRQKQSYRLAETPPPPGSMFITF